MSRHFSASDEHAEARYGAQLIVTRFRPGMLQHMAQQVVSSMARETRLGEVLDHLAQELVVRDPLNFIIRGLL